MRKQYSTVNALVACIIRNLAYFVIDPSTYEIINPADFGMSRYVHFASRLTGTFNLRNPN